MRLTLLTVFVFSFLYLFLLQIYAIWPFTIDDMYISLRYARNWTEGFGLLWNVNEAPVEGYSNFSFVVLGRVALTLGLNPVLVLKSVGVLGLFLTCIGIYHISRLWFLTQYALIPCLWLLFYKGQIVWSVSGLETSFYQALICFSVYFIFKGLGYKAYPQKKESIRNVYLILAGILLALAGMTRPEAPALMLLFIFLLCLQQSNSKNNAIIFTSPFLLFFAPYFLWRWYYYGRLFPNPVYCKGFTQVYDFTLVKQYLHLIWPFILLAIPAIWQSKDQRHYFLWLPSMVYLILLMGADPVVAFDNRLFLPVFVLLLPLVLLGIQVIMVWIIRRHDEVLDAGVYLGAFLVLFFLIPGMSLANYRQFSQNPQAGEHLRKEVVTWLQNHINAYSQVVLADSGLIPYRSQFKFVDSYCLNNAAMTQNYSANMFQQFCHNILLKKPDVIVLTSLTEKNQQRYTPADACLAPQLLSSYDYRLQRSMSAGDKDSIYRYDIFMRVKQSILSSGS